MSSRTDRIESLLYKRMKWLLRERLFVDQEKLVEVWLGTRPEGLDGIEVAAVRYILHRGKILRYKLFRGVRSVSRRPIVKENRLWAWNFHLRLHLLDELLILPLVRRSAKRVYRLWQAAAYGSIYCDRHPLVVDMMLVHIFPGRPALLLDWPSVKSCLIHVDDWCTATYKISKHFSHLLPLTLKPISIGHRVPIDLLGGSILNAMVLIELDQLRTWHLKVPYSLDYLYSLPCGKWCPLLQKLLRYELSP